MAAQFNSPPGWPKPPEGWTPPPGWAPDPSWPPAPQGWQFWTDDAAAPPTPPSPDPQATQTIGTSPTQVLPTSGGPGMYSYAASTGLDQPGASPYGGQGQPPGGYPNQGQYPQPGGPGPQKRNTGAIVAVVVVAVLVLGGLVWGLTALFGGGSDPDPTVTATSDPTSDDPTTDEPTSEEPTSADPTTDQPTDAETTDGGGSDTGSYTDLTGDDPAMVMGYTATDPIAELRLQEIETDWQPSGSSIMCGEPENGTYLAAKFELTTTDALSQEDPATYTLTGLEFGAQVDGVDIETTGFMSGIFCLDSSEQFPSEMQPGETYEGWILLDVPDTVTAMTYSAPFDFMGTSPSYRWVLADQ